LRAPFFAALFFAAGFFAVFLRADFFAGAIDLSLRGLNCAVRLLTAERAVKVTAFSSARNEKIPLTAPGAATGRPGQHAFTVSISNRRPFDLSIRSTC
jgi:hypothetical protein